MGDIKIADIKKQFRVIAENADKVENGGNNNKILDGEEISVFKQNAALAGATDKDFEEMGLTVEQKSIESLIPLAKDYITERGVDENKNGVIDGDRETDILLTGTAASSIEELTVADIKKDYAERGTEKAFITLLATEDKTQADVNEKILRANIQLISKAYENIDESFSEIFDTSAEENSFKAIENIIYQKNLKQDDVNKLISHLTNLRGTISRKKNYLDAINEEYKKITNQDFTSLLQKKELLDDADNHLLEQIKQLNDGYIPDEQAKNELKKAYTEVKKVASEVSKLRKHYQKQANTDIAFCKRLHEEQKYFSSEYSKYADKPETSKKILQELIENISPMTRIFIIDRAEKYYKPEFDPTTGINQNNTSNIKRSSYKTQTKIYKLNGNNVIVSDYSGKVIRTETLDPKVHKGFFE